MESGLAPYVNKDNTNELNTDMNQNLIMSSHQAVDIASSSNIVAKNHQLTKETAGIIINNVNAQLHQQHSSSITGNHIIDTITEDTIHINGGTSVLVDGSGDDIFKTPMYFGTPNSTVVTTQIGATAHIPCTIHHIGDGVVSWIRKKDYHLLTVGLTTYSSDERFSATHLKHSEDWTLQIKFVQLRDAGVYECQVSTHPPTSIFLHLNVVDFQSSELTILKTRREHSGNFSCVASNTQSASVLVHIFKGDNPAAMYHGHVGSSTKSYQTHLHSIMVIISIGYSIFLAYVHSEIV